MLQEILNIRLTRLGVNDDVRQQLYRDLTALGDRVVKDLLQLSVEAEQPNNHPILRQFDAWQNRLDEIDVSDAWKRLRAYAAEGGLVASGYDKTLRALGVARLFQFSKLYLFNPSSAIVTCPLAMTDGAARLIEEIGTPFLREQVLPRLTSTDPSTMWISGQWMTEKPGGSDVSNTETIARHLHDDVYELHGFKWFTSATADTHMTFGLARVVDAKGNADKNLSMFFIKIRDEQTGKLNNLKIHKLKDKLGTKAMPTAELSLRGTQARMIGPRGRGVASISYMLNITRLYNSICAVSFMRRALAVARDWAQRRDAFGSKIAQKPLHQRILANMETEVSGCLLLVLDLAELLNKEESNSATAQEKDFLRLLIPIAKLYTGKKGVEITSEGLEALGGTGYMEDSHMPALLRNAQVLPIWEGTTNVLSLDVLRVLSKQPTCVASWEERLRHIVHRARALAATLSSYDDQQTIVSACSDVSVGIDKLLERIRAFRHQTVDHTEAQGRDLSFSIARVTILALLLEHYTSNFKLNVGESILNRDIALIERFAALNSPLVRFVSSSTRVRKADDLLGNDKAALYVTPDHLRSKF